MHQYARSKLTQADPYAKTLPVASFEALIHIPLALATAALDVPSWAVKANSVGTRFYIS